MTTEESIQLEKLQEGFDLCANQIGLLLRASEVLIENNMFSMALPLTILAREELTKLGLIQDHLSGQKPIPKSKWDKLTGYGAHREKLLSLINRKIELSKNTTPEQWEKITILSKKFGFDPIETTYKNMVTINPSVKTNLESLNFIKQECWYFGFDWERNDWIIMTKEFTKNQLEAIARTHLTGLRFLYYYYLFMDCKIQLAFFGHTPKLEAKTVEYQERYRKEKTEMRSVKFSKLNVVSKSVLIEYEKRRMIKKSKKSRVPTGNTKNMSH